jgi:hypothetical protein
MSLFFFDLYDRELCANTLYNLYCGLQQKGGSTGSLADSRTENAGCVSAFWRDIVYQ